MELTFDKTIYFKDLTDERFLKHDIGLILDDPEPDKNPSGTLFYEQSIVLVRSDANGVARFIPVQYNDERVAEIAEIIAYAFATELLSGF